MDEQMGRWASGLMVRKWINEQMEVDGWRDGCLDEWMIEWTGNGQIVDLGMDDGLMDLFWEGGWQMGR